MCSGWIEWTMKWSFFACRDVLISRVWSGCKSHLVTVDRPYRMHVDAEGVGGGPSSWWYWRNAV